jgi:hypothetical protein
VWDLYHRYNKEWKDGLDGYSLKDSWVQRIHGLYKIIQVYVANKWSLYTKNKVIRYIRNSISNIDKKCIRVIRYKIRRKQMSIWIKTRSLYTKNKV